MAASISVHADQKFRDNMAARCAFLSEVYAISLHQKPFSDSATEKQKDAALTFAGYYKTANYLFVYSSDNGNGDDAKTKSYLHDRRAQISKEGDIQELLTQGIPICKGHLMEIITEAEKLSNTWLGEGVFESAAALDKEFIKESINNE